MASQSGAETKSDCCWGKKIQAQKFLWLQWDELYQQAEQEVLQLNAAGCLMIL